MTRATFTQLCDVMRVAISDPMTLIGLIFFCVILLIIGLSMGLSVFEDEPLFALVVVIGEVFLIGYALSNPWILVLMCFLFGVAIIFSTFISSMLLGIETLLLGIPSLFLFAYSFVDYQNRLWLNILSVILFLVGFVVGQLQMEEAFSEFLGQLFYIFVFSLAIIGVFLIPAIFPQFELITQVAELTGTIAGVIFRVYTYFYG